MSRKENTLGELNTAINFHIYLPLRSGFYVTFLSTLAGGGVGDLTTETLWPAWQCFPDFQAQAAR